MIWKIGFSLLGIASFFSILNSFGFAKLWENLQGLGWWTIPLALSFLPVVSCYAFAWLLVTPSAPFRAFPRFIAHSVISVAWNNLSPFVKVLGEPVRVMLLEKSMGRKQAIESTVLYNLVHMYGTLAAFVFGAAALMLIYPVPSAYRTGFFSLIFVVGALLAILYAAPRLLKRRKRGKKTPTFLNKVSFWLRWSGAKIRIFSRQHPGRFWSAVLMEIVARFVEGVTFYIAFSAMGDPISVLEASLLDVGRALMDNVFFFIPYQMGSREAGILLLTDQVMHAGVKTAVSAAILYRLVEILWMGIGYILWIKPGSSNKSVT